MNYVAFNFFFLFIFGKTFPFSVRLFYIMFWIYSDSSFRRIFACPDPLHIGSCNDFLPVPTLILPTGLITCPSFHWHLLCALNLLGTCLIYVCFTQYSLPRYLSSFQSLNTHRKEKKYVFLQWKTFQWLNKLIEILDYFSYFFPNLIYHHLTSLCLHFCPLSSVT